MDECKVYYSGSLWGHDDGEEPGKAVELRRSFVWAGREFYIPAVYFCREGLVLDLCRKTDPETLRRFADKWGLTPETDDTDLFSPAQQMQMEAEHPLRTDLRCLAVMDGQACPAEHGSATTWHPGEEEEDVVRPTDDVSSVLARQYELDPNFIWYIERFSFRWPCGEATLHSLSLVLQERPCPLPGPCFSTDGTQTDFVFTFPPDGTQHTLHIEEYRQETLDGTFPEEEWEYPRQFTEMIYTLTPDLDRSRFQLRDCSNGDPARRRLQPPPSPLAEKYGLLPTASHAAFVGVIGAGVSAVCAGESAPLHSVCSAVHFTQPERVDWMLVYYQKGADDMTVELWS